MTKTMTDADLLTHLAALEHAVLAPDHRLDAQRLADLFEDAFVEYGASGQTYDKAALLATMDEAPPMVRMAWDFKLVRIAPDAALITYRARRRDSETGSEVSSLRSSIWRERDGVWRCLFHQGTRTDAGA